MQRERLIAGRNPPGFLHVLPDSFHRVTGIEGRFHIFFHRQKRDHVPVLAGLFGEHQRISAVHNDTDNLHIHIAVNKIHPTRNTIHEPYYPHQTLAELCEVMERDYGLQQDNHMPRRRGAEARAADMERHAGIESLIGWIKRECLDEIKAAQSWGELHQVMRDNGLELRARGNGLVVVSDDDAAVKASTLGRDFSKPKLEARFGPFEPDQAQQAKPRSKRPGVPPIGQPPPDTP